MTPELATNGRIIVIDDEEVLRRALSRILEPEGFEVWAFDSGPAALSALESTDFDAVVSDIMMPRMDGIEFIAELRKRDRETPVIFLTGAPSVKTAASAVELGAFRYLTKPFDRAELADTVRRACATKRVAKLREKAADVTRRGMPSSDQFDLQRTFDGALASLWLAYQPIITCDFESTAFGYEALLRNEHKSLREPTAFLAAAETLDRMEQLNERIWNTAAKALRSAPESLTLFVNVRPEDLFSPLLGDAGGPFGDFTTRVVLEVTERASLDSVAGLRDRVATLRRAGFRMALDDLGAGYAGLSSFVALEPDFVKLDMSLVRRVHKSEVKRTLIRKLVETCHTLGILVVAEGVETSLEREALTTLRCDFLQGYALGRPAPNMPRSS